MIKTLDNLSISQIHKLLTMLGIVLALQINYIQHGWINDDSVLYFEVARLFSTGEWKQGVTLFNWPLYPLLISVIQKTLSLSIQASAILLNVLFFVITTYSFISIIRLAGGNKVTILCGAFLLFSSSYIVGSVLPMLLRDQGFWAAFLTSLVFFIKFYRGNKLHNALLWQVSAIIAMLFRIEAITFLVCLPLLILVQEKYTLKEKLKQFIVINTIPILGFISIAIALLAIPSLHLHDFGRLQEAITIFPRMINEIAKTFETKATIMGTQVLGDYFSDYGLVGVIVTLVSILTIKIVNLASWPVIGIFAISYKNNYYSNTHLMHKDSARILLTTAFLSLLNATVIIASAFVLSNRYIISFGFVVFIFAAFHLTFILQALSRQNINTWHKSLLIIFLTALCLSCIKNILPKGAGYTYEQDAIAYVKGFTVSNNRIFYVTPRSRYFAGATYTGRGYDYWSYTEKAIEDNSIYKYDYLVINLDIDEFLPEREKILSTKLAQYHIEKEFYGYRKKKKITIYVKNLNSHIY